MQLATSITLYAGGPGSGRHPGPTKPENEVAAALRVYEELERQNKGLLTLEGRILRAGHAMSPAPLTKDEQDYIKSLLKGQHAQIKQCYMNNQRMVMRDFENRLKYHEGYIVTHGIPLHHAWVTINGKVVDATMHQVKKLGLPRYQEHKDYWGVTISRADVLKHMMETETYGPVTQTPKYSIKYLGAVK